MRCVIYCVLLVVLLTSISWSQDGFATLARGNIEAILDTNSGRFGVRKTNGDDLLFSRDGYVTSHISVLVEDVVFTNTILSGMKPSMHVRNLGKGTVTVLADRIRYEWTKAYRGSNIGIRLELEPTETSTANEVLIHLMVDNVGRDSFDCGVTIMEDVSAGENDDVVLSAGSREFLREEKRTWPSIPSSLVMRSDVFYPDSGVCRIIGDGLVPPDEVTVGSWEHSGYLGTAVYGYSASGKEIHDSALLLQWNSENVDPGARRHVITAVGVQARELQEVVRPTTFARHFVIPRFYWGFGLYVVSDTTATINIVTPYQDMNWEATSTKDGKWDTTAVVTPGNPVEIFIDPGRPSRTDSVDWYQKDWCELTADADVGMVVQPSCHALSLYTMVPESVLDTAYYFPGSLGPNTTSVRLDQVSGYLKLKHAQPHTIGTLNSQHNRNQVGETTLQLPERASIEISYKSDHRFDPWNPVVKYKKFSSGDGAGDLIVSDRKMNCTMVYHNPVIPGGYEGVWVKRPYAFFYRIPSRTQLGKTYCFLPFKKPSRLKQSDLVRVIVYEDSTRLRIGEFGSTRVKNRGAYLDTLLEQPTVLYSDKPIAVYQYHIDCRWLGESRDTTYYGGALVLSPEKEWGNKYFLFSQYPTLTGRLGYFERNFGVSFSHTYDNLYIMLIKKKASTAELLLDGKAIDTSLFSTMGEYSYAYIDISNTYHEIESSETFCTYLCGGGYEGEPNQGDFGISFMPPHKTMSKIRSAGNKNNQSLYQEITNSLQNEWREK
ncbi:MAG: hypothetical protein C0600_03675 [Ignavibacteria bacterium]|nr:MAG: hypothetical protein C0600_03675 [Ignavibacteria bacterium]